jgi:hypothetical protein
MKRLHAKGKKSKILLRTMGQEKVIDSNIVHGLEISGLDNAKMIELPNLFTQSEMPVSKDDVVQQNDLKHYPYLKDVQLPSLDSKVELLIGNNCVEALEPWEIINSENGGPYAIRTKLGWTVSGVAKEPQDLSRNDVAHTRLNRTSVISDSHLHKQLINQL